MENLAAMAGFVILITFSIRMFKFLRHKIWLYLIVFLIAGMAISIGFAWMFGATAGWAGNMAWAFAGGVAVLCETYLEKKFKMRKRKVIKFIRLDKHYKVYIYRLGLFGLCLSGIGLILIAINSYAHWRTDILKTKKNPEFNGLLEQFFYLMGWLFLFAIVVILIALLIEIMGK